MKKYLLFFSLIFSFIFNEAIAQPATVGVPVSIGRDNCGTAGATVFANTNSSGGTVYSSCAANDSVYFFGYSNATLSKSTTLFSYLPRLRIGDSTYQGRFNIGGVTGVRNFRDRFTVSAASVSYNPRDRMIYYIWTDYNNQVKPGGGVRSYVWRWPPDTTFAPASIIPYNFPTATPPGVAPLSIALLDTIRSFTFDIGGVTFDNIGTTWQLEFSNPPAPYKSMMRKLNFTTGVIDPIPDTLDLIPGAGGRGGTMYNVGSGDITLMPNGQMYYVFDNKLYTPDYGSYGGSSHHINSTYIDTVRRPGAVNLVGLAFSDGDLISSYSPGCVYRRIDPITGDTNFVNYTYPASKGVRSSDMTQITSGLGVAKRLVSAISTGVPKQYDVVYDVYVKNYGTTRITNIQVKDSLGGILGNGTPIGNGSVSNVSLSMQTIPPPPGIAINPGYNGTTNVNLLQSTGQNLNNFPADSTSFIVRINCRLSNIDTGVVYNNSAVGFANGYKNVPLRDSSTNGNVPDLNQNDKPDDVGESVPTPLLIALAGTRGGCATLTATLYTEDFGTGTGLSKDFAGTFITTYTGVTVQPIARNTYTLTDNAKNADTTNFVSMTDHTGNANGRMMVFNADAPPRVFFRDTMPTSCPGRQYSLTFWTAFPANSIYAASCAALGGFRYPKVKMRMIDIVTGLDVVTLTTDSFYSPGWVQKGMRWTMPKGYSNLIMELSNAAPGGCGNDMVLDDIVYGTCDALPTVNASSLSGCLGDSIRFVGSLADSTVLPGPKDHQWQVAPSAGGPWTDISGATLPYLTINPILPADTGKFYRLIVAAQGSIAIPICRSTSPGVKLTGTSPSTAPTSISAPSTTICSGSAVTLTAVGGTLGGGANYQWGTGSTVGTSPISGATSSTLTVSPTSATSYWVRIENTSSPCASSTGGTTLIVNVTQPSIAPTSITGADICNGGSTTLTAVGGTLGSGANYQWGTGSTPGTNPIGGATSSTYTVSPTVTTTYWVKIKNTTSPCADSTAGVTKIITVSQPSVAPSSITGLDICNGSSTTLTAVGGTLGSGANYQWGTGSTPGTNPIAGATSSTYTVSPTVTTTYWVKIKNTTSPCADSTAGVTKIITVTQPSVAPSSITGLDICNGSSTTLTAVGGTLGTSANYQWGTGSTVGTSPISGATSSTLTVSPTSNTTYWVRIENTSSPCTATTTGLTRLITVTQPSVAPTSITAPSTTICNGSSVTLTAAGGTLGTSANYQWGTGSTVGTSPIGGATSSTLSVSPTSTTTYWVRIENTASPCTAITGGTTLVVTVNQPSVAPTSITGLDICNGSSTTLTALGGTLGTSANYQWGTGSTVGTSPISGATSSTLTVSPTSNTTYWVRIENTLSPCTATTTGLTRLITVTQPSVAPTSITAPSTTICNGSSVTLTAAGGTLGTSANYQWGTGSTVGTSPIGGATSSTLTVSPTSTTTYWVRIENTASPCTAITGGTTLVVTVNQPSVAPSSITGLDICNGSSTTLTAVGGTLGTSANYQWGTGSTVGTSPISGATSSTLTVSPTSTTTYWVRIENTSSPCTATTTGLTRLITVRQPSVAPSSITGGNICNPGSVTLTAVGGTLGTSANYQWGTGSTVGTSPIGGATSSTLTVSPGSTTTYWVRIENTSSPCTATTSGLTRVVTVNQPSVAPTSITGLDICNGSSTTLTALGGTLGTSANYQWGTGSTVGLSPISGATSSTLTVSPTSTTTYWVRIENTSSPCTATTTGLTRLITVNQPSVAPTSAGKNKNGSICPGISVKIFRTGGSLGTGATWRWYTGSPGGTLIGTGDTLTVTPSVNTKYYIRAEGLCNTTTPDSVLITISCDIDKDDDGIPDFVENRIVTATNVAQAFNTGVAGYKDNSNDFINDDFQADGDSDNDGIVNYLDTSFPGRVDVNGDNIDDRFDNDLDGIVDMLDLDSDNDGIPDVVEANGVDANGDGRIDNFTDTDGDGLSQNVDANNTGANNSSAGLGIVNFDTDNVNNEFDADSDNDGIPDVIEAGGPDTNNDGIIDGFVDANNDGLHDSYINATGLLLTGADITSDGRADSYPNKNFDSDFRPNAYDVDSDGDGILDVTEAGFSNPSLIGWVVGPFGTDGWSDVIDAMPSLTLRNTDGRGNPDHLDIDSDDDGIPDQIEGQPTANPLPAGYMMPLGTDPDRDGLDNRYDNAPAAFGGSGILVMDLDGDSTPDYRDLDTDSDGQLDIYEGNDFNMNNIADDNVTLTFLDSDGDGLDNRFDSSFGVKGTSYNLANGGYTAGDPAPGARCPVSRKYITDTDRAWRYAGSVLPIQILNFTGTQQNNNVLLSWAIITPQEIDHFEIERSVNNTTYSKVGQLNSIVQLNINQAFSYPDDITNVNSDVIYYRLKVVAKSGEIKYSNVLVVRKTTIKNTITVMPNPAYDYLQVRLYSDKQADVSIRLIDASGKLVLAKKEKVQKGNNNLQLNELSKFAKGNYMLQLNIGGEVTTHKIMLLQ